jgi:CYTH domain-containing protein
MGVEIERKFLVHDGWRNAVAKGIPIRQGYLATGESGPAVRIRIKGEAAYITIKGVMTGIVRAEYEYAIPVPDATEMLDQWCDQQVDKTRYEVPSGDVTWEIDEFHGANAGLVVAEVELESGDQPIDLPAWVDAEVTTDPRYLNSSLAERPYSTWS